MGKLIMNFFPVYVDAIIFRFHNNEIQVRLKKRPSDDARLPNEMALEGVLINPEKDLTEEHALARLFQDKIGLNYSYSEQLNCYANKNRDPSGYSLIMPYLCLVESTHEDEDAIWLDAANITQKKDDYLPFDHVKLIKMGYQALLNKSSYSSLPLFLIEQPFRYSDIRKVFEATLNKPQHKGVLRKRILPILDCINEDESKKRDSSLYNRKDNTVHYFKTVSEGLNQ
jgi:8-oxo-dGTP diphosphatase